MLITVQPLPRHQLLVPLSGRPPRWANQLCVCRCHDEHAGNGYAFDQRANQAVDRRDRSGHGIVGVRVTEPLSAVLACEHCMANHLPALVVDHDAIVRGEEPPTPGWADPSAQSDGEGSE